MTAPKLRKFEKIPIFIVEDHNHVLEFIYRCLGARRLPFNNNKIIHFDSHPDMTIPKTMPAEFVCNREKLLDALSIENWLMPTCYAGHINEMIWIKPEWATQIPNATYRFTIGDYCGCIRCDSYLEYFLSEGTWQPQHNLSNQRLVNLGVFTLNESLVSNDVSSCVSFQTGVDDANEMFILDVDLDFFSTTNPFLTMLEKGDAYEKIKKIFKADFFEKTFDSNTTTDELTTFTTKRLKYLDQLESVFQQLDEGVCKEELQVPDTLENIRSELFELIDAIEENYGSDELKWTTVYDAGCTFDSNELPHHVSTDAQIENLIELFEKFLRSLKLTPSIITIARSSDDDYCPKDQVDRIQGLVLETIFNVYGEKVNQKPILHYKDEEWTV